MSDGIKDPNPAESVDTVAATQPLPVAEPAIPAETAVSGPAVIPAVPAAAVSVGPKSGTWAFAVSAAVVLALGLSAVSFGAGLFVGRQAGRAADRPALIGGQQMRGDQQGGQPYGQPPRMGGQQGGQSYGQPPMVGGRGSSDGNFGGRGHGLRGGFPGSQGTTGTVPPQ